MSRERERPTGTSGSSRAALAPCALADVRLGWNEFPVARNKAPAWKTLPRLQVGDMSGAHLEPLAYLALRQVSGLAPLPEFLGRRNDSRTAVGAMRKSDGSIHSWTFITRNRRMSLPPVAEVVNLDDFRPLAAITGRRRRSTGDSTGRPNHQDDAPTSTSIAGA
jgi:hypothetical protein